jgi:hypothetical protein
MFLKGLSEKTAPFFKRHALNSRFAGHCACRSLRAAEVSALPRLAHFPQ